MHEELWCPEGHEARDPRRAGPSSALCGCGARFSTRPGVQAAYRAEAGGAGASPVVVQDAGPERVGPQPARRAQPADDPPRALLLAAWPEPGPRAILSTPSHLEPAGDEATFEQGPEDHQDPPPPERRSKQVHPPDTEAIAPEEPEPDFLDWLFGS